MKLLYNVHKHGNNEGESDEKHAPSKFGAFSRAEDSGYRGEGHVGYDLHCHRQNRVGCWRTVLQ